MIRSPTNVFSLTRIERLPKLWQEFITFEYLVARCLLEDLQKLLLVDLNRTQKRHIDDNDSVVDVDKTKFGRKKVGSINAAA